MQGVAPQNRHISSLTQDFLDVHWDQKKPLLLGYSGGPDSKALLYALLECGVKPHLAHVDHGWRKESKDEAEMLKREAASLGLPFHSVRVDNCKKEDEARKARFAFFQSLIPSYRALLLAHQSDDLAETVLKRLLEGAHLPFIGGMEPVSKQYGMDIWRPLLKISRKEIEQFVDDLSLSPIIDETNFNTKYLRSRMRYEMIPNLSDQFGKEVSNNLVLLSERAAELRAYLDQKIEKISIQRGPWGMLVDLNGVAKIEKRHLLQKVAREESTVFSRSVLENILVTLEDSQRKGRFEIKNMKIFVDAGRVWFFSSSSKF